MDEPVLSKPLAEHWSLFEDWCEAFEKPFLPTTADTIVEFLRAFPSGVPTNTLRVRAVRQGHELAGRPVDLNALRAAADAPPFKGLTPPPTLIRHGDGKTRTVGEVLAQLPKVKHGKKRAAAMRGRRDALIVVLFGQLRFSRDQLRKVAVEDIAVNPVSILGREVSRGEHPESCPACAVTRWLRILLPAELGFKDAVVGMLDPTLYDPNRHDCEEPLHDEWKKATTLLPAIDQHGWVSAHNPVTTRSVSAIAARVQQFTGHREQGFSEHVAKPTRFDEMPAREFTEVMDDFDRRVAEALALSAEALDDANEASEEMWRLLGPKAG